jgi:hypothetical protein
MPMVGHIAQTGQIVASDFRAGNVSSNTDNLGLIKTCQDADTVFSFPIDEKTIKTAIHARV